MAMESYNEVLDYLFSKLPMYQTHGQRAFKSGLEGIVSLLNHLDNPHKKLQCIHIGGTNGKGSSAHILSALMQGHDFKVGMITSPHYMDFRERIKINNALIPESYVLDHVNEHRSFLDENAHSFFEYSVALAFDYFCSQDVDYVIVEVGMGGRLDSTNVIEPILTGITNIGMDHKEILGPTKADIAREKAGIIKHWTPVVIGDADVECTKVFKDVAKKNKAPLVMSNQMAEISHLSEGRVNFNIQGKEFSSKFDLLGSYQSDNLRFVLCMYRLFCLEVDLTMMNEAQFNKALGSVYQKTYFLGRFQSFGNNPRILMDSAHNTEGIESLVSALSALHYSKLHIVLALTQGKDVLEMLKVMPKKAKYYISQARIPRALPVDDLEQAMKGTFLDYTVYPSLDSALDAAEANCDPKDTILITGSVFTVAELLPRAICIPQSNPESGTLV